MKWIIWVCMAASVVQAYKAVTAIEGHKVSADKQVKLN